MEDCESSPPFVFQNFPFRMTKILIDNYGKKYYYLTHKKNRKRMIASTLTAVSRFRGLPHISILIFLCAPVNSETMVTDLFVEDDLMSVIDRIKALSSDDCTYDTFSGKADGVDSNEKFIIETDPIE